MAESITGNVTGKIGFKIDKKSWDTLEKFKSQLTSIKRQMSTLHKTVKVQAVVKQVADVNKKIVKAQEQTSKAIVDTKVKMARKLAKVDTEGRLSHLFPTESSAKASNTLLAKQMVEQQKILDKANKAQFAADLKAEKDYNKRRDMLLKERAKRNLVRSNRRDFFNQRADMYQSIKLQQASHAGVATGDLDQIRSKVNAARAKYQSTGDIAAFRNEVQLTTRSLIHNTRQMNANAVSLRTLRTDLVQATAAYTAFSGLVNVAQTGMDMEGLRAAAKVFAGDEAGVAEHMTYIANEAERLGTNLMTSTKEFTKFAISTKGKVSKEAARDIFSGVSEYAAVLQADPQQFERAFRSINQMMSKGSLMAEEVRGQLGESLFGAIPILAQAYGFSADQEGEAAFFKAMERGELAATEDKFLAFAKGLSEVANANGALEAVTKKTRAEMNRFFNQLTIGKDTIFGSGLGEGLAYAFGSFSNILENMQPTLVALGGLFKGFFSTLAAGINGIMLPIMGFGNLIGSIFGKDGATVIGALAGGALMVSMVGKLATGFIALRKALVGLSIVWAASPMGLMTRVLAVGGAVAAGYGANALMSGNTFGTPESAKQKVEVSIGYKTEEAKKLIDAQINTRNSSTIQDLSMLTGGV